ncbi:MAG TPA: hypothetical protein VH743_00445 [Beijerinckiaceae bacterium]|jgi:hypothetical protein
MAEIDLRQARVDTGTADEDGRLAYSNESLVAILVRLSDECHGPEDRGRWHLECGFGPCTPLPALGAFESLDAAKAWITARVRESRKTGQSPS